MVRISGFIRRARLSTGEREPTLPVIVHLCKNLWAGDGTRQVVWIACRAEFVKRIRSFQKVKVLHQVNRRPSRAQVVLRRCHQPYLLVHPAASRVLDQVINRVVNQAMNLLENHLQIHQLVPLRNHQPRLPVNPAASRVLNHPRHRVTLLLSQRDGIILRTCKLLPTTVTSLTSTT